MPVISIHLVVIFRILLKYFMCLHSMESCRMSKIELLHVSHFENAFIEVLYMIIPEAGAAFLYNGINQIHIDNAIADIRHDLRENTLINAWKHLRIHEFFYRKIHETIVKPQLVFNIASDVIEFFRLATVHPLGHKVIAVGLVRCRNKTVQSCKVIHTHGACCRCKQNMTGKLP